ncbi:MAG: protein TolQ [Alphaproteobacteria bacterium]|nr:protein TolQ [Alphaproteobacteria bacterium]
MYGMFAESDLFMKLLILGLLFASFWCWAIIYDKIKLLRRVRMGMKAFEEKFWSGGSLETLYNTYVKNPIDPLSAIFVAAMTELKRSLTDQKKSAGSINLDERIDKVMQITIDKHADKLETKMVFLASTGSVAPLLGLFGTVWGIMDSFNAIGATQSTNIAAVAPGVAEALFTTAVGLIAAIPALIAYNKLTNDIDRIVKKMETFSDELGAIVSRQVEQMEK